MIRGFTLSPQKSSLIATVTLAVGAVMFLIFFFKPRHEAIGSLRAELEEKQQYLDATGDLIGHSVQQAHQDLNDVRQFVDRWKEHSPSESQLASVYARIARLGKQHQVVISRFDPQDIQRMKAVWQAPVELSVDGEYSQIVGFLHDLEQLPLTAWIDHLRIEQTATATGDDRPSDQVAAEKLRCELIWVVFSDYQDFSD